MLLCTRRLSHALIQSPHRCYIRASQPIAPALPGVTIHRDTSATVSAAPSSPAIQKTRFQYKMKAQIEDELRGATFYVDLTAKDGILHADPGIVEAVNDSLRATFQALTSGGHSSATKPQLPEKRFSLKTQSYRPLINLLNKIIDTANRYAPQSQLSELRFHHFGGKVKETYGSHRGLKPDGVGIIGELPTKKKKGAKTPAKEPELSWGQIEVFIDSKSSVEDIVRQSGTYARCCLLNNPRRFFSLGIGFDYRKLEAYVLVFHRSGLSSSRPIQLTTSKGFKGLVSHIVGILSFKDEAAYGLDTTRFERFFRINNRYYEIVLPLHMRGTLRGHSTSVYRLRAVTASTDIPQRDLDSRTLKLSSGVSQLPDELAYKVTYPVKGYSQEGPLLSQFHGQFGIADVIGYHECGAEDLHGSTSRLFNKAEFLNLFKQKGLSVDSPPEPEARELQCIAFSGEGKALVDLETIGGKPSPGELLETILHAIIGHYNMFKKGVLHRDVSTGNILRYSEPIRRPALDKFDCTRKVDYCRGFLIDGDKAVKWREFSATRTASGTIPFMSWRILNSLKARQPLIQTALDDLESFLWILIWCIAHISKDIKGATFANKGIESMFRVWADDQLSKFTTAEDDWTDAVFGGLINDWLDTFRKARKENKQFTERMSVVRFGSQEWDDTCNELESYCNGIYEEVLMSGFRNLEPIREYSDWDRVVADNMRSTIVRQRRQ